MRACPASNETLDTPLTQRQTSPILTNTDITKHLAPSPTALIVTENPSIHPFLGWPFAEPAVRFRLRLIQLNGEDRLDLRI